MQTKTLWIHAGGAKAGSSALQSFFIMYAANLRSLGFSYRNKPEVSSVYQVTGGNGKILYEDLSSFAASEERMEKILLSYFEDDLPNAICSSEFLQLLDEKSWKTVISICESHNIALRIIFYIRDPVPYYLSQYDQAVKGHGEWKPIDEWHKNVNWDHLGALRVLARCFPKSSLHIISYDLSKQNLINNFLDIVGINAEKLSLNKADAKHVVNRSLTVAEREIMRRLNKAFGARYSPELTDLLMSSFPDAQAELEWDPHITQLLSTRFKDDIVWINETFFEGKPIVTINGNRSELNAKSESMQHAVNKIALDWAISKLKVIDTQMRDYILRQFTKAIMQSDNAHNEDVPADFDAVSYLLLNTDVLMAGINPAWHFVNHGRSEGRSYLIRKHNKRAAALTTELVQAIAAARDEYNKAINHAVGHEDIVLQNQQDAVRARREQRNKLDDYESRVKTLEELLGKIQSWRDY
ncbi:MAG: hypothetical protein ACYC7L_03115 [Nitrospirota bacterium]